jgi:hypothetical protein
MCEGLRARDVFTFTRGNRNRVCQDLASGDYLQAACCLPSPSSFHPTHRHIVPSRTSSLVRRHLALFALGMKEAFTIAPKLFGITGLSRSSHSYIHTRNHSTSTATSANTDSPTISTSATTLAPYYPTSSTTEAHHQSLINEYHQHSPPNMATYYQYDDAGNWRFTSDVPLTQGTQGHLDLSYYEERGDVVGAFLAQRDMLYHAYAASEGPSYERSGTEAPSVASSYAYSGSETTDLRQQSAAEHESYNDYTRYEHSPEYASSIGRMSSAAYSSQRTPYPDPEDIRHLHTLHSLLPLIQHERKLHALQGRTLDIVEKDTGVVFAYQVPKKLLVLFLGRDVVNRFIRTIEREDKENWCGAPVRQELSIPKGQGSEYAFRILVSWMYQACRPKTMRRVQQFNVPSNTLTACTLAQILTLFGLHKDALRIDWAISKENFKRPIFAVELEALWNCLGEDNRYVCAAIKKVGQRLQQYEAGSTPQHRLWKEMLEMLEEYPPLKSRVRDLELNETHQPQFSTEWCKRLSRQQSTPSAKGTFTERFEDRRLK